MFSQQQELLLQRRMIPLSSSTDDTQTSAPSTSTPTKPCNKAMTQTGNACTSTHTTSLTLSGPAAAVGSEKFKPQAPSPQRCMCSPLGVQAADSASSDASRHHIWFTLELELLTFPFGHPYPAAVQGPWAGLCPLWDPWVSMSVLGAAAVAVPRPPPSPAPAAPHCPT